MGNEKLPMRIAVGQMLELTMLYQLHSPAGIKDVQFNFYHGSPHLSGDSSLGLYGSAASAHPLQKMQVFDSTPSKTRPSISTTRQCLVCLMPENMQKTIRNMGRAGIPIFGYHFIVTGVWRTSSTAPARGGGKVTAFDYEAVKDAPLSFDRVYSEDEIWKNYEYYIKALLPVAEEAGVILALHPDDPPVRTGRRCPHHAQLRLQAPWRSATAPIISSISALAPGRK